MFFLNSVTRVSEDGRGWFASPCGGTKPWPVFRIVFGSEGPFRGQVTNAGLVCLRTEFFLRAVMLHEVKHPWFISVERERSNIAPKLKASPRELRPLRYSFASLRMTV